jgi:cellulose synthase (UDP-forming)
MKKILENWRLVGTKSGFAAGFVRIVTTVILLFLAFECITIDFKWPEQVVLGVLTIVLTLAIHRVSKSELVTLALMFASMLATARYAYWRISTVIEAIATPNRRVGLLDVAFMLILLSAEIYAFGILFLGYIQTVRPLRRPPVPLPKEVEHWPAVDVLIPTYNEPLSVVRSTAFAAMNIDYPQEKLHVYVLDDGRREDFRAFCEKAGIGYITRKDNLHAKAGNINHALGMLNSPFVAIFDCDHVPTRSFLQVTLGWFFKDGKLAMLQTPHFFYSPDPFERNLHQFKAIPNEGELFYGVIQDSNDLWNATFFCGSCAVLRRTALNEIGGIATETVTEDAHTSLRMQIRGWNTAYINIPQAAGLATESLSSHVGQRIRWARGMIQVLRNDNPLFARGLKWPQRLCYFNAMVHFLYAVPRLIFLTAPLVYMLLGLSNIPGDWIAILAYAMPHLFLANVTNLRVQGKHRHSFWNEVYETVLAPYILVPTLLALVNPKLGKFNVTAKGGIVDESYFDSRIARPYVALMLLNVLALVVAPFRFFIWNANHPGTVAMNVVWILFNMVIIGSANAVAFESRQVRSDVRIDQHIPIEVRCSDGRTIFGESNDMSLGGASLTLEEACSMPHGSALQVIYPLRNRQASFPALVVSADGAKVRLKYEHLSIEEEELMTLVLYSRADTWLARGEQREVDKPMRSLAHLVVLSLNGLGYALGTLLPKRKRKTHLPAGAVRAGSSAAMITVLLAGGCFPQHARAADTGVRAAALEHSDRGAFHSSFTLKDIGVQGTIQFRGMNSSQSVTFALSPSQVAQQSKLNLRYGFSPGLLAQLSHLNVLLNGVLIATLASPTKTSEMQDTLSANVALPAELLGRSNVLGFQFVGHSSLNCEDPANTGPWAHVEASSSIDISGSLLPLADDLKILPLPFYDSAAAGAPASIPFHFSQQPSNQALQAAGIVASWFGVGVKARALKFSVTIGDAIPKGNVILFVEGSSKMPAGLDLGSGDEPVIAVRTNPNDLFGKVLVIYGDNGAQLITASRNLALEGDRLQGRTLQVSDFQLPPARRADDAPLWLATDRISPFWTYSAGAMGSDGSAPVPVYIRLPPDLYFGDKNTLPLHVDYRYDATPLARGSILRVSANGSPVNELPLPHEDNSKKTLSKTIAVPLVDLEPFANTFLLHFIFQPTKTGPCQSAPPASLQGSILRSSYLDLRGVNHLAALPNLGLFASAGYPFTRFADLSQTEIVMPTRASPEEIDLYLEILAYFGEQTGYPASRVTIGDSSSLGRDVDYLVLGTVNDQPAFEQLSSRSPVLVNGSQISVRDTGGFFSSVEHAWWQAAEMRPNWWWELGGSVQRQHAIESIGQFPDALIQATESPSTRGRSIITIMLKDSDTAEAFTAAFLDPSTSADIGESVSILRGHGFVSYRLGDMFYHVGELPWWSQVRYWLREFPWLIVVLTFVLGVVVVPWTKARLDRRVLARLEALR